MNLGMILEILSPNKTIKIVPAHIYGPNAISSLIDFFFDNTSIMDIIPAIIIPELKANNIFGNPEIAPIRALNFTSPAPILVNGNK